MENKELLELLLNTSSPSGYEVPLQKKIIKYMEDICDESIKQANGNVIHVLNKDSDYKILFLSHIDEVGLIINEILNDGTCKVENIGAVKPYVYIGQHVNVLHNDTKVPGVFGYLPNLDKGISSSDLILDLGCNSLEEAKKIVSVGDPVVHMENIRLLSGNRLASKALDDKIAAYIFLSLMKRLKGKTNLGIYVATTVGEETLNRGALSSVSFVNPNLCICSDVAYANDIKYRENLHGEVRLGNGPILTSGSIMNKKIDELLVNSCNTLGINYQREVAPGKTWTDSDFVYYNNVTTPTYLVSIPLRYMHSPVEVCDLNDISNIIDMLEDFILKFDTNTSFNPFDN